MKSAPQIPERPELLGFRVKVQAPREGRRQTAQLHARSNPPLGCFPLPSASAPGVSFPDDGNRPWLQGRSERGCQFCPRARHSGLSLDDLA